MERSFAWLVRNRRLRIDDERKVQTSETLVAVAFHPLAAPTAREERIMNHQTRS